MKVLKFVSVLSVCAILLSGCAATEEKESANSDQVNALIQQAKTSFEDLDKLGAAWRDVEDMIKDAEKAVADGELAAAEKLAKNAIDHNRLAMLQHESQKNADVK